MTARDNLRTALDPKSVAIVGASDNPDGIGGARGHVTDGVGRLRAARQRPPGHDLLCSDGVGFMRERA